MRRISTLMRMENIEGEGRTGIYGRGKIHAQDLSKSIHSSKEAQPENKIRTCAHPQ